MASSQVRARKPKAPAKDTAAFGAVAERFRRSGALDRAVDVCREGLRKFPDHVSARVTLGWALLDLGRYDDARIELEQVLRRAPDNLAAIRGLAELHDRFEHTLNLPMDGPGQWPPPPESVGEGADELVVGPVATTDAAAPHGAVSARADDFHAGPAPDAGATVSPADMGLPIWSQAAPVEEHAETQRHTHTAGAGMSSVREIEPSADVFVAAAPVAPGSAAAPAAQAMVSAGADETLVSDAELEALIAEAESLDARAASQATFSALETLDSEPVPEVDLTALGEADVVDEIPLTFEPAAAAAQTAEPTDVTPPAATPVEALVAPVAETGPVFELVAQTVSTEPFDVNGRDEAETEELEAWVDTDSLDLPFEAAAREAEAEKVREAEAAKAREVEAENVRQAAAERARQAAAEKARQAEAEKVLAFQRSQTRATVDRLEQFLARVHARRQQLVTESVA